MSREVDREFEVRVPEEATPAEEERLVEEATDREVDELLDDLGL